MPIRSLLLLLAVLAVVPAALGQGPPTNREEYEARYRDRIRQESLYGVYIPADVPEAIQELYKRTSPEGRRRFAAEPEARAVRNIHFSLGRWIIHQWGFYGGSRLSHAMRTQMGIYHPDEMARFIMIAFHRSIREEPLDIQGLIEQFQARQDSARAARDSLLLQQNDPSRGQ